MSELQPAPAWAKSQGHTIHRALTARPGADEALDRALIAERVYRYGWSVDDQHFELLADCFTADCIWQGDIMGSTIVGPFAGREAIMTHMSRFWPERVDQRRHFFSNVVVDDYTGRSATVHAYLILMVSERAASTIMTTGPYRVELVVDTDGVWRMSKVLPGFDSPY